MGSQAARRLLAAFCLVAAAAGLQYFRTAGAQADDTLALQFTIGDPAGGTGPGQFIFPFGIAVDSTGRLIVTDSEEYDLGDLDGDGDYDEVYRAGNRLQAFHPDGTFEAVIGGMGSEEGQFWYATGVAVDALDQIIVADSGNSRIQILSPASAPGGPQFLAELGSFGNFDPLDPSSEPGPPPYDRFYFPTSVAVKPETRLLDPTDGAGRLAIVDNGNHRVVVLNSQLGPVLEFGGHTSDDNPPGTFEYPWGVAIDVQGLFYVSDPSNHRVQVFGQDGGFLWAFGSDETSPVPFAGDLSSPSALAFDLGGRLLVADSDRSRVLRVDITNDIGSGSALPRCSDVGASVALHECQVLASDGRHFESLVLGGFGTGDADFQYAQGVGADAQGRVIVVDTDQHLVKVFQPARIEITAVSAAVGPSGGRVGEAVSLEATVANRGGSALTVTLDVNASLSGTLTGDLSTPLAPGAEHTFALTFVPEHDGALTFTIGAEGQHGGGVRVPAAPVTTSPAIVIAPALFPKLLATVNADRPSAGIDEPIVVTITLVNSGDTVFHTIEPVVTFPPGLVTPADTPAHDLSPLAPGTRQLTYYYTAAEEGVVTFTATVNAAYDDAFGSHAYPTQTASSGPVRIVADTQPPATTVTLSAQPDPSGWHRAPFTVTLTAADGGGSGVATITYRVIGIQSYSSTTTSNPVTIPISAAFQGPTTLTFFATDANGNTEQTQTRQYLLDSVAPDMGRVGVSPAPNAAGWHRTDVVVSFVAGDGASGIASVTLPVTLTTEGAGQVVRGTARDQAGNESHAEAVLNIDKTPPALAFTLSSPPNASGWHSQPVTVTFSATDQPGLSGVASVSQPQTVSADGIVTITGTATDVAGNTSAVPVTIRMDRTPPGVTCGTASGGVVWPPNHKMVPWSTYVVVQDLTSQPAGFLLTAVGSSEPDNGGADGNTTRDIQGFVIGTPDTYGFIRAERAGTGEGRIYSLLYEGRDLAGNVAACTVVTPQVPHDQGRRAAEPATNKKKK